MSDYTKRRIIIGVTLAVVMFPALVAGFVFQYAKTYFISGQDIAKASAELLDEWLG